jgi:hypothetical protein
VQNLQQSSDPAGRRRQAVLSDLWELKTENKELHTQLQLLLPEQLAGQYLPAHAPRFDPLSSFAGADRPLSSGASLGRRVPPRWTHTAAVSPCLCWARAGLLRLEPHF